MHFECGRKIVKENAFVAVDDQLLLIDEVQVHERLSVQMHLFHYLPQYSCTNFFFLPEVVHLVSLPHCLAEVLEEAFQHELQYLLVSLALYLKREEHSLGVPEIQLQLELFLHKQLKNQGFVRRESRHFMVGYLLVLK